MFVKPILKFIAVLCFSLAYFIPEISYIESTWDKQQLKQAASLSNTFKINPWDALEIVQAVGSTAEASGFTPSLLYGIIHTESSFRIDAKADKGKSSCLMQIHTSSGYKLLENTPEHCIVTGTNILLNFWDKTKSTEKALQAYYCGNKFNKNSCKEYKNRVLSNQRNYKGWI